MIGDVDRKCLQAHQEQKIKIKNKDRQGNMEGRKENGQMYAHPFFFYFVFQ